MFTTRKSKTRKTFPELLALFNTDVAEVVLKLNVSVLRVNVPMFTTLGAAMATS
jgi:hypothetical protein